MISYLRSCIKYFAVAGLFSLFINTLALTFAVYMEAVYVRVLPHYSFSTLYVMTAMALTALVVLGILHFLRSRILVRAGIRLDNLLTRPVVKEMLKDLCRADGEAYKDGLKDIYTLRNYLGGNSIFAFFDVPWIFIYLWVIYLIHPFLGITATGGAVVTFCLGLLQNRVTRKETQAAEKENQKGRQWLETGFRTARELQSMGMIANAADGYCAINDREMISRDRAGNRGHILGAVTQSFSVLMQVIIYGAGAILVIEKNVNTGVIIAASIIMGRALAPVSQGIAAWRQTADAKAAYFNLSRLLNNAVPKKSIDIQTLKGTLTVEELSLDIGATKILDNVNFSLNPGEILGLIGPNGAGKTSLCRVILGMWKPAQGQVTLDGHDVFDLDNDGLGQYIGYLPQNVELFDGTVGDNIARMGRVDESKVVAAAKRAGAHEVILGFEKGYDTDIGEAGSTLSGGQRQRVGLARALYGKPGLVILDEPNANLDEAGEKALMAALGELKRSGATTIMITHKPGLLVAADKILVLEQGRVARFGARDEVFGRMTGDF